MRHANVPLTTYSRCTVPKHTFEVQARYKLGIQQVDVRVTITASHVQQAMDVPAEDPGYMEGIGCRVMLIDGSTVPCINSYEEVVGLWNEALEAKFNA